jgi:hypothetical protein
MVVSSHGFPNPTQFPSHAITLGKTTVHARRMKISEGEGPPSQFHGSCTDTNIGPELFLRCGGCTILVYEPNTPLYSRGIYQII